MSTSTVKVTRETRVTESSGPGTTSVRKTTYSDEPTRTYKSMVTPRTTIINRTAYVPPQRGGSTISRSVSYGVSSGAPGAGAYANVSSVGVSNVKTSRDREKKDMQDLNERFASYIEKVRFLEAQNRKLGDELDKLKSKWGKETTAIKAMYDAELTELRKLLDDAEKEKSRLEIRCATLEEQIEEMREELDDLKARRVKDKETIERQNQQLSDYEAEINLLRRRIDQLEDERAENKKRLDKQEEALNRARVDLDNETLQHIDAENRRQTLEEEMEFRNQIHEQELKELAALAYRDTTKENREFWKSEMASCLREIQGAYDEKLEIMKNEQEQYYTMKLQEFRTGATRQGMESQHAKEESKKLRTQINDLRSKLADMEARCAQLERELDNCRRDCEEKERDLEATNAELQNEVAKLRAEMEAILVELQGLMDTKLGLELEIAAYRKLLEGEESRIGGMRSVVESLITTRTDTDKPSDSQDVSQVVKGEMSAKTTYQRSAKGPVSVADISPEGKFITLENTGKKDETLDGWKISRNVDNKKDLTYTIPKLTLGTLRHNKTAKIWAKDQGPKDELQCDHTSWGVGANITTKLINTSNEERATHVQRTIYTS